MKRSLIIRAHADPAGESEAELRGALLGEGHMTSDASMKSALRVLATVLCLALALPASAGLAIQLQRISDTDALMVIGGELDLASLGGNAHALALMDPFSTRPPDTDASWVLHDSDMHAAGFLFNFANQAGRCSGACPGTVVSPGVFFDNSGRANTIYFGNNDFVFPLPFPFAPIPSMTAIVGSMHLRLQNGATFAAVGAAGDVYWGTTQIALGKGVLVGTWQMVGVQPVPEPSTYAMMLAGLGWVGLAVRRRKMATITTSGTQLPG